MARHDDRSGGDFRPGEGRWRDEDRERSDWRSGRHGTSEREDERGFFQRAGDEVRSWFNDENERRYLRDYDRDRDRGPGLSGRGRPDYMREDRDFGQSGFGGTAQGGMPERGYGRPDRFERERGYGPPRSFGEDRSRFGQGASGADRDWNRRGHPQSWGEANRAGDRDRELGEMPAGYSGISDTLGGFGNQRFGSIQDEHYRSWRDRQMDELDRDYEDFRREREQQFHQDFDSWRRQRQTRPTTSSTSPNLGAAPLAGVGTTTSSVTGTGGEGTAAATGASTQEGTSETADTGAGTGGGTSGRSRTRS